VDDWLDKVQSDKSDYEARMRKQHRCRACGVKLKPFPGSSMTKTTYWPLECEDCRRTAREPMLPVRDRYGSAQASLHHELQRRMGYSAAQAGAPGVGDEE